MRYSFIYALFLIAILFIAGCDKNEDENQPGGNTGSSGGSSSIIDAKFDKLRQSANAWANKNDLIVTAIAGNRLVFNAEFWQDVPSDTLAFKRKASDSIARNIVNGVYKTRTRDNRLVFIEEYLQFPFRIENRFIKLINGQQNFTGEIGFDYIPMDGIY